MATSVAIPQFIYAPRRFLFPSGATLDFRGPSDPLGNQTTATFPTVSLWPEEVCAIAQALMTAASASNFLVRYDPTDRHFIMRHLEPSGNMVIDASTMATELGFATTPTVGQPVESDTAVPADRTITLGTRIKDPRVAHEPEGALSEIATGARWAVWRGGADSYRFRLDFEAPDEAKELWRLFREAAMLGEVVEFRPDSTLTDGIDVHIDQAELVPREGPFRRWTIELALRALEPPAATDDITIEDLIDRGPA